MLIKDVFNKLLKKEQHSQRILFEMFYDRVYKTAYFITQDQHIAQDVVQETFIKAFHQMHKLRDGSKMEAWLARIASNTALDFLRKRKRRNETATEDVYIDEWVSKTQIASSVEQIVEDRYMISLVREQILTLSPEYRQVIVLKYEHDFKDEEIAQALGISLGTVKSRLSRAKQKLRLLLEKHPDLKEGTL
jgi:RNA polymerase sigma factor (sigma-70 family)